MRYEQHLIQTMSLFDQYVIKRDKQNNYLKRLYRQLLIYDSLPDDSFAQVLEEVEDTLGIEDPSFRIYSNSEYQKFVQNSTYLARWHKIAKDHYYFVESETRRRNKDNPYHNTNPKVTETWDELPNFAKQKRNEPYQFDHLYRDAQILAGQVYVLTKDFSEKQDKDLFRAKVNSLLVPDKIVFALNSTEALHDFSDIEINIMDIKIGLDSLKLAEIFLNRVIESLHKISRSETDKKDELKGSLSKADDIMEKLKRRIKEMENKLMLYMRAQGEDLY